MDKQQAVDFVLERIAHDYTQEEIVRDLSHHLKAPIEVLNTFVARVEEQHPHIRPEPQTEPEPLPPAFDMAETTSPPTQPDPAEQAAPAGLPSAFLSNFDQAAEAPQSMPAPQPAVTSNRSTDLPNPESGSPPAPRAAKRGKVLEDPELAKIVLGMLKKSRKRSEITMFVCERTGLEWSQAQRFVAQVEVDNHQNISAHKNVWLVGFGVLFALAGLVVLLFGLISLAPYVMAFSDTQINLPFYIQMQPDAVIGILVTGFGLLVGGIVGAILALQSQNKA